MGRKVKAEDAYQGEDVGEDGVHVAGALAVEHGALCCDHRLHDQAVDDAQEEGAEVQRALYIQHLLGHAPAWGMSISLY